MIEISLDEKAHKKFQQLSKLENDLPAILQKESMIAKDKIVKKTFSGDLARGSNSRPHATKSQKYNDSFFNKVSQNKSGITVNLSVRGVDKTTGLIKTKKYSYLNKLVDPSRYKANAQSTLRVPSAATKDHPEVLTEKTKRLKRIKNSKDFLVINPARATNKLNKTIVRTKKRHKVVSTIKRKTTYFSRKYDKVNNVMMFKRTKDKLIPIGIAYGSATYNKQNRYKLFQIQKIGNTHFGQNSSVVKNYLSKIKKIVEG